MAPKTVPAPSTDNRAVRDPVDEGSFIKYAKQLHDIFRQIANRAGNFDRGHAKALLDLFTGDAAYKPSLAVDDAAQNAEVVELLTEVSNPHQHSFNSHIGSVIAVALKNKTLALVRV